jgi:hypothetical protein
MAAIFSCQAVCKLHGVATWKTILIKRTPNLIHLILSYQKQNCEFIAKKVLRTVSGQHTHHLGMKINKILRTGKIGHVMDASYQLPVGKKGLLHGQNGCFLLK